MKKVIITGHNLGRLANQLWQYISVYAYCLEHNFICENIAFFEYESFFPKLPQNSRFFEFINKATSRFHKKYGRYVTYSLLSLYQGILKFIQPNNLYIQNWTYRQPKLILKWRNKIKKAFKPATISPVQPLSLKNRYRYVVGVHIRKGDYNSPNWRRLFFADYQVAKILQVFLKTRKLNIKDVCFIICSDGKIEPQVFANLNTAYSGGTAVEDLFLLSQTDLIIGSDSTFGALASYFGNIPYIVFNKTIDWDYYKDKRCYFENKYNTTVNYKGDNSST